LLEAHIHRKKNRGKNKNQKQKYPALPQRPVLLKSALALTLSRSLWNSPSPPITQYSSIIPSFSLLSFNDPKSDLFSHTLAYATAVRFFIFEKRRVLAFRTTKK
jgi:hypothetical protein